MNHIPPRPLVQLHFLMVRRYSQLYIIALPVSLRRRQIDNRCRWHGWKIDHLCQWHRWSQLSQTCTGHGYSGSIRVKNCKCKQLHKIVWTRYEETFCLNIFSICMEKIITLWFLNEFEISLLGKSGFRGKRIHEKPETKSLVTLSLCRRLNLHFAS